jgi:hypothetical protein
MKKNIKWLMIVAIAFAACNKNDDTATIVSDSSNGLPLTAGSANFSKYVSLGNSLTAGYSDGTLFKEGQKGSYPAILASKFSKVGGGAFTIPFMADNVGGFTIGGTQFQGPRLFFNGVITPTHPNSTVDPIAGTPSTEILTHLTGSFNNMGVPGAKSFHLLAPNYGNPAGLVTMTANPFFVRFASTPSAKIIDDAMAQSPTFFSLWIGNNDVLSYASGGGTGVNQLGNLNPATYGDSDITDPNVFASAYSTLVNTLTANGAKGVVANLPYVNTVPFFTTVPTNPVPLTTAQSGPLNSLFGALNGLNTSLGETTNRFVTLGATNNPVLIIDETLPPRAAAIAAALTGTYGAPTAGAIGAIFSQARHARNTAGNRDYVLLTSSGVIGATINTPGNPNTNVTIPATAPFNILGVSFPLQDRHVLTADETMQVKVATDAYNTTIQGLATSKGLAFVNANSLLTQISSGGIFDSYFNSTSNYVWGGAFSLDGVHPSPRGYALIANEFMKSINLTYGSNLKPVSLGDYRILFPQSLN